VVSQAGNSLEVWQPAQPRLLERLQLHRHLQQQQAAWR
jgi:hypothetical protein